MQRLTTMRQAQLAIHDTRAFAQDTGLAFGQIQLRQPRDDELAICRERLASTDDSIAGLRDVLWALLNSKEFILNH